MCIKASVCLKCVCVSVCVAVYSLISHPLWLFLTKTDEKLIDRLWSL